MLCVATSLAHSRRNRRSFSATFLSSSLGFEDAVQKMWCGPKPFLHFLQSTATRSGPTPVNAADRCREMSPFARLFHEAFVCSSMM